MTSRQLQGDGIDQHLAWVTAGGNQYWYLTDHLGSTRDTVDTNGALQDSVAFDAYGNILGTELAPSYRGLYAWTGRELDAETGLQYNRARYYDASTGRWINQDPMGFDAGDGNLYRYVSGRYLVRFDPSGENMSVLTSDGLHSDFEVDLRLDLPSKLAISTCTGRMNFFDPKEVNLGVLTASWQANGFNKVGNPNEKATIVGLALGTAGSYSLAYVGGRTASGNVIIKGKATQDAKVVNFVLNSSGISRAELIRRIMAKLNYTSTLIKALPNENIFSLKWDVNATFVLGNYAGKKSYSLLMNNCNDFTYKAMQTYIGHRFAWGGRTARSLIDAWNDGMKQPGPDGYPPTPNIKAGPDTAIYSQMTECVFLPMDGMPWSYERRVK